MSGLPPAHEMMQSGSEATLEQSPLWPALRQGTAFAAALGETPPLDAPVRQQMALNAMRVALASVSAALIAASAQCRRASPPADITEAVTNDEGSLVYRCSHAQPHYWKLDGTPI